MLDRVLHISPNQYPALPAEHHTKAIWTELAACANEYHILGRGSRWARSQSSDGKLHLHLLPSVSKGSWFFIFTQWLIPLHVWKLRPSVLLVQCPLLGGLAALLSSKLFKVPLFVELHAANYFAPTRSGWKGWLEHRVFRFFSGITLRSADTIRTLSKDMTEAVLRTYGEDLRSKIVLIPTRVDLTTFGEVKRDYRVGASLKLATVGSLTPRKNHLALVRALHDAAVRCELSILGAGPLRDECAQLAEDLNGLVKVSMHGNVSHQRLSEILPQQDIYIHYALSEGLPRAILEAMAVGLPVIATPVGFIGGVLEDDCNCRLLVEPWAASLALCIREVARDERCRRRLGEAARATVLSDFDSVDVYRRYREALTATGALKCAS